MQQFLAGFNSLWGYRTGALIRSYSYIVPLNWWDKYGTYTLIGGGLIVTTWVFILYWRRMRK